MEGPLGTRRSNMNFLDCDFLDFMIWDSKLLLVVEYNVFTIFSIGTTIQDGGKKKEAMTVLT